MNQLPQQQLLLQQQQNQNFAANLRNNKLAQKYVINSVSNYYESFAVNQMGNNSPNSPLIK